MTDPFGLGFAAESKMRLRELLTRFGRVDRELVLGTEMEVALLAHEVAAAMHREFEPHDRTGKDSDPAEYKAGYEHTIDTLKVDLMGMTALISMRGGAAFVEYGSRPHVIEASPGKSLAWKEAGGGWRYAKRVFHPGYKGDDFVGRAIKDVVLVGALAKILEHTGLRQFVLGKKGMATVMERSVA
jgi:hypothetical protein